MRSLLFTLALLPRLLNAISLWDPAGPYHVGYTQHILNHTTPIDPTPNPGFLLLTIYYPTLQAPNQTVPYADTTGARAIEQTLGFTNGSLSTVTTALQLDAPALPSPNNSTTLIFTPGAGAPAVLYTAYLSDLASRGHTLLTIDHPGEAPYTPLPAPLAGLAGLPYSYWFNTTPATIRHLYNYRLADIAAALSSPLLSSRPTGILGHSIGGSTAAGAMAAHHQLRRGANLDGTFQALVDADSGRPDAGLAVADLAAPFLEVAAEARFAGREDGDETWALFNAGQSGWLRDVQVNGTAHLDYSDVPLLVDRLGARNGSAGAVVGPVGGGRVTEVVTGLVARFFGGELGEVDRFIEGTEEAFVLAAKG